MIFVWFSNTLYKMTTKAYIIGSLKIIFKEHHLMGDWSQKVQLSFKECDTTVKHIHIDKQTRQKRQTDTHTGRRRRRTDRHTDRQTYIHLCIILLHPLKCYKTTISISSKIKYDYGGNIFTSKCLKKTRTPNAILKFTDFLNLTFTNISI